MRILYLTQVDKSGYIFQTGCMAKTDAAVEVEEGNKPFRFTEQKVESRDPQHGLDSARIKRVWSDSRGLHYSVGGQEMNREEYFAKTSGK